MSFHRRRLARRVRKLEDALMDAEAEAEFHGQFRLRPSEQRARLERIAQLELDLEEARRRERELERTPTDTRRAAGEQQGTQSDA